MPAASVLLIVVPENWAALPRSRWMKLDRGCAGLNQHAVAVAANGRDQQVRRRRVVAVALRTARAHVLHGSQVAGMHRTDK